MQDEPSDDQGEISAHAIEQINKGLRMVFLSLTEEEIPKRFLTLLDQLAAPDPSDGDHE